MGTRRRALAALLGAVVLAPGACAGAASAADAVPTVGGSLVVGTYVTRDGGCAGPLRWYRDGEAIERAIGSYLLRAADLGNRMTVRVTCAETGNVVEATSSGVVTASAPQLPVIDWMSPIPAGGNIFFRGLSSTLGDPTDPGTELYVAQLGTDDATRVDPAQLQIGVAVQPTGRDAVPIDAGEIEISGTGATRRVVFHPHRQGIAKLVFTVTGTSGQSATYALDYFVSQATTPTSRVLQMSSDASTAIGVGDGKILLADDEISQIGLYDTTASGAPLAYFGIGAGSGEADYESSARTGDSVFWLGSHGNSKKGEIQPSRHAVYESRLEGVGASARLTAVGSNMNLRADLLAWDRANGNRFGLTAAAAAGNAPDGPDRFNVEGAEFSPDDSELYLGFRAPLAPRVAGGKALIVPVRNIQALTRGQASGAQFGEPILLDLGGHSIRELRRNAAGEYLILSGEAVPNPKTVDQALWYWDGRPETAPERLMAELPHDVEGCYSPNVGAWEGIGELPDSLEPGSQIQLIMDQGYDCLYAPPLLPGQPVGDENRTVNKDFGPELGRKSRLDTVTLAGALGHAVELRGPAAFERQTVLTVSEARPATVTNTGVKPLALGRVLISDEDGSSAAAFRAEDGACAQTTLAPGATCTVGVRFAPTQADATAHAQLVIESDAPGGRATAALTGSSIAALAIDPDPDDDPPADDPPAGDPPRQIPPLLDPPSLNLPSPQPPPSRTTVTVRPRLSVTPLGGRRLRIAVSAAGVPRAQLYQRLTVRVRGVRRAFAVRLAKGGATVSLTGRAARAVRTGRPLAVTLSLPAVTVVSGTVTYRAAKTTRTVRVVVRR